MSWPTPCRLCRFYGHHDGSKILHERACRVFNDHVNYMSKNKVATLANVALNAEYPCDMVFQHFKYHVYHPKRKN